MNPKPLTRSLLAMLMAYALMPIFAADLNPHADQLLREARNGNAQSMTCLGMEYFTGTASGQPDMQQALHWWTQAARKGNTDALMMLGYCNEWGIGIPVNPQNMLKFYLAAARAGNPEGYWRVLLRQQSEKKRPASQFRGDSAAWQDNWMKWHLSPYDPTVSYLDSAADHGHMQAYYIRERNRADWPMVHKTKEENIPLNARYGYDAKIDTLTRLADNGNPYAAYDLACLISEDFNEADRRATKGYVKRPARPDSAYIYLIRAIYGGVRHIDGVFSPFPEYTVEKFYRYGIGCPPDAERAERLKKQMQEAWQRQPADPPEFQNPCQ